LAVNVGRGELVPGDAVPLAIGQVVSAAVRVVAAEGLE
jgi:hypothetical protein